jgi:hypothetical protein
MPNEKTKTMQAFFYHFPPLRLAEKVMYPKELAAQRRGG